LNGLPIEARDGPVGSVTDVLFEDDTWKVRWLIVHTGPWLFGRDVLLPSSSLATADPAASSIPTTLTRKQVADGPGTGIDLPISRQMETALARDYQPTPYGADGMGGAYVPPLAFTAAPPPSAGEYPYAPADGEERGDPNLRSAREISGYYVHADDGEIGHVEDFLVDDVEWVIRYVVVDTKNWWPGKHVLATPEWITGIDWSHRIVRVAKRRQQVKDAPEYDPSRALDPCYEARLHRYYASHRPLVALDR
jgi:hypothetical protein